MFIKFVEIQNFRKLKSIRVDLAEQTTLFVGANNSGKTSAMTALRYFLVDKNEFTTNDFTLSNWVDINKIGIDWEAHGTQPNGQRADLAEWDDVLPSMDVWLQVAQNEIHYVNDLIPTLDWEGGLLGVRLRLEPKDIDKLYKEFLSAIKAAKETMEAANLAPDNAQPTVSLWPKSMSDFLERRVKKIFTVHAYSLDPTKLEIPEKGMARPQSLPAGSEQIADDPFGGLIRIDEIKAQRGLGDATNKRGGDGQESRERGEKRKLSEQLQSYYVNHLNPYDSPEPSDIKALEAIHKAQIAFDERLKDSFSEPLRELENMGYPGITDPKITISTKIRPTDGLNHDAAVQYEVIQKSGQGSAPPPLLPEQYNGLGYQNLISMVFRLMSFRDGWMRVGKAAKKAVAESSDISFEPLHLVLVEEPEAHLHAQVQQVFIRQAYDILRDHDALGEKTNLATQLVVSTHSSHIAHECDFSTLRYFRRQPAVNTDEVPTSTVVNLSEVFGKNEDTQRFVTRYLKTTHCDLFFADAAILVEGPAERILVPHFVRQDFNKLNQRYITLLEIGGSHAHTLRPLIEKLGLITLIITDLDSAKNEAKRPTDHPRRNEGMVTRNEVLKTWIPKKESIDELLDLDPNEKIKYDDQDRLFSVRVAYQCPVNILLPKTSDKSEALSNTFEDALVFENLDLFATLGGFVGLTKKFSKAIAEKSTVEELGKAMFDALKSGKKAEFALDVLFLLSDQALLKVPTYIHEGLSWLQEQVERKQQEVLAPDENPTPEGNGEDT